MAARKLGIGLKRVDHEGKVGFIFGDVVSQRQIVGIWKDDAQSALKSACEILVNHLSLNPTK